MHILCHKAFVRETAVMGVDSPPYIKTAWEPNLQSVTKDRYKFHDWKKIFAYIKSSAKVH